MGRIAALRVRFNKLGWLPRVFGYVVVFGFTCLMATPAYAQIAEPIPGDPVRIDTGMVSGTLLPSGVKAYLGLRYAQPPTDERRWKAPQPLAAWKGVYHADRKMPECIQVLRPHNINHYFGEEATSEDCLFMNVWVPPNAHPGDKLPVIVFIYGGAFTVGSSGMASYGGENVARSGAIFVNFNYRLGLLGFMADTALTAESPQHSSGNYGFLDQIAALEWIHRNIAAFGGDPAQVIISGQSAGSMSVSLLQASPLAKGLFRGIVGMSGSVWMRPGGGIPTLAEAEKTGTEVAKALHVNGIAALRAVPADRLLALQEDCQMGCSAGTIRVGGANIDGYVLPATPAELFAQHRQSDVPVVTGFTSDEAKGFNHNDLTKVETLAQFNAAVKQLYGTKAGEFHKLYPASTDAEAKLMAANAVRDAGWPALAAWQWAKEQSSRGQAPVFVYEFARVQPFNPAVEIADHPERIGAYHSSDVPYWFQTLDSLNIFRPTRLWTSNDRELARSMTSMLIAFARTGDPSIGTVKWPAWKPSTPRLLDIGSNGNSFKIEPMNRARLDFQAVNAPSTQPSKKPRVRD